MNFNLKVLILSFVLMFSGVANAQESQLPIQLTPEAKKGIELMAKGFGLEAPAGATKATPELQKQTSANVGEKSVADVADRALNMVEQGSKYMEDHIKKVAPELWRIMVRQQYGTALGNLMLSLGWMIAAVLAHFFLGKMWALPANKDSEEHGARIVIVAIIPTVVGLWAFIVLMWTLGDSVKLLFNPEYYAVRDLVRVILAR
jgi:hypothetical protein